MAEKTWSDAEQRTVLEQLREGLSLQVSPTSRAWVQRTIDCVQLCAGHPDLDAVEVVGKDEIERLRLQLAGCGVAAMQNTDKTRADRIDRNNPYWSASYGDVCAAVDREMALRAEVARLRKIAEAAAKMEEALEAAKECLEETFGNSEGFDYFNEGAGNTYDMAEIALAAYQESIK